MQRLSVVVVSLFASLVVLGGCDKDNPESCELPANAGNGVCPPPVDATDAPPASECMMNSECIMMSDKHVCDTTLNAGTCVQCTTAMQTACAATQACVNNVCGPCVQHTDCVDSQVCMPDHTCANPADVAYVDGGGTDQPMCTKALPCTKLDKAAMAKSIVKVTGTLTQRATLNDLQNIVILAGAGAKLTPTQDGAALDIRGNSIITIYDLEISHLPGDPAKDGIALANTAQVELINVRLVNNTADGAHINDGHLTCTHCTIENNKNRGISMDKGELTISRSEIKSNKGGGIYIPTAGKFQIVGNFIFGNGASDSQAGGIKVSVSGDTTNRIDFNSVSHNSCTLGTALGIDCISTVPLTAKYNVVWNNGVTPFDGIQVNTSNCSYALSDVGPMPAPMPISNFNTSPGFVNEDGGDLHLASASSLRGLVKPLLAEDVTDIAAIDVDGDSRTLVVMMMKMLDLGADQTAPLP